MRYFTTELALHEFQQVFPDEESCLNYLMKTKWKNGFECPRCGNNKYCQGRTTFHSQCTRCKYQDSPTSHTIFHRVRFPLHKGFYIVFFMLKSNKRVTSTELSQKIDLRQKTCWFFQEKIRHKLATKNHQQLIKILEDAEEDVYQKQLSSKQKEKMHFQAPLAPANSSINERKPEVGVLSQD